MNNFIVSLHSIRLTLLLLQYQKQMHIVIAGNIGSGKTTLTEMLAKHYGWEARYESVTNNPYLNDYYKDIARWSFNLEIFFLKERFKDVVKITECEHTIVQDRSIMEGVYVFTAGNHEMGNLSDRDYETYISLFEQMMDIVKQPDLMIYLRASVPHLVANIQKRGRDYEQSMQIDYLKGLNERYEDFVMNKYTGPKIIVEKDELDFQHNPQDFNKIINAIDARLYGLFK